MNEMTLVKTNDDIVVFDDRVINSFIQNIHETIHAIESGDDRYADRKSLMSIRASANKITAEMKTHIKTYEATLFAEARAQIKMIEAELDSLGAAVKKRMAEIDAVYNAEKTALIELAFKQTMTYYDFDVELNDVSDVRWWNRSTSEKAIREQLVARLDAIQVVMNVGLSTEEAVDLLSTDKWDLARVMKKIQKTADDLESPEQTLSAVVTLPISDKSVLDSLVSSRHGWLIEWNE